MDYNTSVRPLPLSHPLRDQFHSHIKNATYLNRGCFSVVLQTCILFIHKESEKKKKENPTHNLSMLPRYARACHTKEGVYKTNGDKKCTGIENK